jgi:hypothetical protein
MEWKQYKQIEREMIKEIGLIFEDKRKSIIDELNEAECEKIISVSLKLQKLVTEEERAKHFTQTSSNTKSENKNGL